MSLRDLLQSLGISLPDMAAGFSGGVANAFALRKVRPIEMVGSVLVGALTANYLSDAVRSMTGYESAAVAFVIGLTGMAICQGLIEASRNWHFKIPGIKKRDD